MNELENIAIIGFCYWRWGKLNETLSKPKSARDQLVDKACVYDETEEVMKEATTLVECIIENKKAIGYDYSRDSKFLDKLKKI